MLDSKDHDFQILEEDTFKSIAIARRKDNPDYKTQDFIAGIMFNTDTNTYDSIVCKPEQAFQPISYPMQTIIIQDTVIKCGKDLLSVIII